MKRKSQQVQANVIRSLKKHKTQGNPRKKQDLITSDCSRLSQIVVTRILEDIAEDVHNIIKTKANEELISLIILNSQSMAANLSQLINLPLHENQNGVVLDREPERVAFDPICGFDKLITMKNDVSTNKFQEASFIQTKSKLLGAAQIAKKQQVLQKSLSTVSKLIPLDSLTLAPTKTEKQNQKQESFYRERIYDSGLPMLTPSVFKKVQKTTSKLGFQNSKQAEDCVYEYNGEKSTLSVASKLSSLGLKQSPNNVLKTTYRLLENSTEEKKKNSLSKVGRGSHAMEIYRISKQIIKNPNLSDHSELFDNSILKYKDNLDQSDAVKNILEASFREKDLILKPIQRTYRASKIL